MRMKTTSHATDPYARALSETEGLYANSPESQLNIASTAADNHHLSMWQVASVGSNRCGHEK